MELISRGITIPEFTDANGTSRIKEINWFTESGISGSPTQQTFTQTQMDTEHTLHPPWLVKNLVGPKNADIRPKQYWTIPQNFRQQRNGHIVRLAPMKTNGRPTVVNMSYGYVYYPNTATQPKWILGFNSGGPGMI